jgi:acetyl/propionyl-CoA carboxylase alpha subunit
MAVLASVAVKSLAELADRKILKALPHGWRNNFYAPQTASFSFRDRIIPASYMYRGERLEISINGAEYITLPMLQPDGTLNLEVNGIRETFRISAEGNRFFIHHFNHPQIILVLKDRFPDVSKAEESGGYVSPMPATVVKLLVHKGDAVKNGQSLIILSSMKMENTISASEDGTVEDIFVTEGENIEAGRILLQISA